MPRTFEAFAAHLRCTPADAVFILGDLFEVWVGDDVAPRRLRGRGRRRAATGGQPAQRGLHGGQPRLPGRRGAAARLRRDGPGRPDRAGGLRRTRCCSPTATPCAWTTRPTSGSVPRCAPRIGSEAFLAQPLAERRADGREDARRQRCAQARTSGPSTGPTSTSARRCSWMHEAGTPVMVHGHTHRPGERRQLAPGFTRARAQRLGPGHRGLRAPRCCADACTAWQRVDRARAERA